MRRKKRVNKKFIIYYALLILFVFLFFISYVILKYVFSKTTDELISPHIRESSINEVENKLKERNLSVYSILQASSSSGIIVTIDNNFTVYFSTDKDIDWQISTLQSIIHRLTIERRVDTLDDKNKIIDFRFDKPIIKF